MSSRWSECPMCARVRRLNGGMFVGHRRARSNSGGVEMITCEGSGARPDSAIVHGEPELAQEPGGWGS